MMELLNTLSLGFDKKYSAAVQNEIILTPCFKGKLFHSGGKASLPLGMLTG